MRPEILAPAGNWDAMAAAVYCGADAIYLGGKNLNARRNAGNFDDAELARAVAFCHVRGVKVYETLNTILFDDEEEELFAAAKAAASLGIDGAIVQDFGVLRFLREAVPNLPLIASTQMAVHNLSGALEAERLGCSVVVLARELTREEIASITAGLQTAKTEVFIHGAHCMSVSGQCYLSAMLGGRSGNRGLCAQPCRLPFAAGHTTHALSLKDLSLVEHVRELEEVGVHSLKIEGRMKRPEYVAAAVTAVRTALDGKEPDMETLRRVFSRSGFTSGYFDGQRDEKMFGIRQKEDVTASGEVLKTLGQLAVRETPRVALRGAFTAAANQPMRLTVRDSSEHPVNVTGSVPEKARTKPTEADRVRQSLEKTGGTPFFWEELSVTLEEGLMIPVSQVNAMRREALSAMEEERGRAVPLPFCEAKRLEAPRRTVSGHPVLRARCEKNQLSAELISLCDQLILPYDAIESALALGAGAGQILTEIPRILFSGEDRVRRELQKARAAGITAAWCGNLGAVRLAREAGLTPCGGWSLNLTNTRALLLAKENGLADAEVSFEISRQRLSHLGAVLPYGILAYGYLPLMVYRNCPMKAAVGCGICKGHGSLTDRTGTSFPLRCRDGVTELFNSVPLYWADRLKELSADFYTLWFTTENAELCRSIAAQYAGTVPAVPPKNFTRGLYTRTVL